MAPGHNHNILVVGGAGYIGGHTCKALARAGYLPVTYDNLVSGHEWAVKWGPLEHGDIRDRSRLAEVIARYRPTAAIHLAAYACVGESVVNPAKYYHNNVVGTLSLLEELRAGGVDKLVFSSTCATYGAPLRLPIDEAHPRSPVSPYGHSKEMIEQILRDYDRAYGLRTIALRYFNVAGADLEGELGEDHDPETHLIPLAIEAALGRRAALSIFGDDFPTPDGTAIRDYIHVVDLAVAHLHALEYLESGGATTACNLGTGCGYSVREIVSAVEELTGRELDTKIAPRRAGDPPALVAAPERAYELLGWRPLCSGLATIVGTAIRWARAQSSGEARAQHAAPRPVGRDAARSGA
ncbi:UDP-glucose 4-epimerase [Enhygromyxa salina]|uniref:UDP-glucose 4-epimerase n=1 Tax=Enhygromyxa salina TaxID=215803 RepID=A0A2S9XBW5_9BACT|nr:UDP-glucose 4-epimerase GalE [Enhygromyxa salina]PRP90348.1 UDP-glucose 4-epimerase [Enhygromyxa salina]